MSNEMKKVPFRRNFISLESKVQILDRLDKGEKVSHVAKTLNLSEATIRTIKKHEEKIRNAITEGSSTSANMRARPRAPIIEKMEKVLSVWIENSNKEQVQLDGNAIKQKALEIYNDLKENGEPSGNTEFVASKGWFERFKNRFSLHNMTIQSQSTFTDSVAARTYEEMFQKIIEDRGYVPHQVFNAVQTGLWWKKMPSKMFASRNEKNAVDFTASKDHLTLLMCSNASGDYMIKPMLIYRSSNPHIMKSINKNMLPVYWKADRRTCLTAELFKEWFLNCFVPAVENYINWKNLDFKVLLLLDDAPSHPKDLSHPNIEVIYLPSNVTSLIQPLEQGIVSTFKTNYIKRLLQWILGKVHSESIEVVEAWKQFSILNCIGIIALSLNEIKPSALNACWKNIWPESVYSGNIVEPAEDGICAIVELAKSVKEEGFDGMTHEDVHELLVEKEADIIAPEVKHANSDDSADENVEVPDFTLANIREGLSIAERLESYFSNIDPSTERSEKFREEFQKCLMPYYEVYNDLLNKSKEAQVMNFLKGVEETRNTSEAENSERVILPKRKHSIAFSSNEGSG